MTATPDTSRRAVERLTSGTTGWIGRTMMALVDERDAALARAAAAEAKAGSASNAR
jgi:hypothetical protein